jgi:hypothetical protein
VAELTRSARSAQSNVEMYIMNWPWWDENFTMRERTDPSIG